MTTLYNANVRAAYVAGDYDGVATIDQVAAHGGFGLGALDRNDGELVILDGAGLPDRLRRPHEPAGRRRDDPVCDRDAVQA